MLTYEPYDPLDKKNLGLSISHALTECVPTPLDELQRFLGAGVYMIYYTGDFEPYRPMAEQNQDGKFEAPIYVGKAVPSGSRIGANIDGSVPEPKLYDRLREHRRSIELAENIDVKDFYCRYLVVADIWIPLGENLAIASYSPIWNHPFSGFGNHDPGSGRRRQEISKWDVLHPGRQWATLQPGRNETQADIINQVELILSSR
jgi:hypothetical protein